MRSLGLALNSLSKEFHKILYQFFSDIKVTQKQRKKYILE